MSTLPALGTTRPLGPKVTYPYPEAYPKEANVDILLAKLPWNETNLPTFTSKQELDEFLDDLPGTVKIELDQFRNTPPQFTTPLELPYDVALEYTYMRVRITQAAPAAPLPYETPTGKKDYYYFVEAVSYANPSTSYFDVTLDVWHTFFNDIELVGDLKRGHLINELAPSVADYLANPLENTNYLTAPDFNIGDPADLYAQSEIEPFGGTADRYLCIWGNYTPEDLTDRLTPAPEKQISNPTYNDANQMTDRGEWVPGADYETLSPYPPAPNAQSNLNAPYGLYAYAIQMTAAPQVLENMDRQGQHVLNRTVGAAVLPDSLITRGDPLTTGYGTLYPLEQPAQPMRREKNVTLAPEKWGLPQEIADYTKAYTYPYAHIVIAMPDGTEIPVQIETLGEKGVSIEERLCAVFPWLSGEVFLQGYKNNDTLSYSFKTLENASTENTLPQGAWMDTLSRFSIPTFTIWKTSQRAYKAENNSAILAAQNAAANAYTDTRNSAYTNFNNTDRTLDTGLTNANASADTAYANTAAAISTGYTNSVNAANAGYDNSAAAANAAYANTIASTSTSVANQSVSNAATSANQSNLETFNTDKMYADLNKQSRTLQLLRNKAASDFTIDNNLMWQTLDYNNDTLATTTAINSASSIASGVLSGAASGFVVGGPQGAAVGAAAGLIGGAVQTATATAQAQITMTNNIAIVGAQERANEEHYRVNYGGGEYADNEYSNAYSTAQSMNTYVNLYNRGVTNRNINAAASISNNNKATTDANAARSRDAALTNADRARDTSNSNSARDRDTSNANAARMRDTTKQNAQRATNTGKANNTDALNNTIGNAQRDYTTPMENARHAYKGAGVQGNQAQTSNSGAADIDVQGERTTTFSYVHQSIDALKQTAQLWRRYGYSYNGRTPRALTPSTSGAETSAPCTYWQIEDITFTRPLLKMWQDKIASLLAGGVTFWKNPLFTGMIGV